MIMLMPQLSLPSPVVPATGAAAARCRWLRLEVEDNGVGISATNKAKL